MPRERYTPFSVVYKSFLSKITDDMYMQLTESETQDLLEELLMSAIHKFEFPRHSLDYAKIDRDNDEGELQTIGAFIHALTHEQINILATYMIVEWLGQQLASCENVRMKYSGLI